MVDWFNGHTPGALAAAQNTRDNAQKAGGVPAAEGARHAGTGTVSGTLKVNNTPAAGYTLRAHLWGAHLAGETVSGAGGAYAFNGLSKGHWYQITAHDHTGTYNAVVANRVVPV